MEREHASRTADASDTLGGARASSPHAGMAGPAPEDTPVVRTPAPAAGPAHGPLTPATTTQRGRHAAERRRRRQGPGTLTRPLPHGAPPSPSSDSVEPSFDDVLGVGGECSVHRVQLEGRLLVERRPLEGTAAPHEPPAAWDHPHLVRIEQPETWRRGQLLEHLPGGSVEGLIAARGPLPVGEAVTLLVPIARALAHLHAGGAHHGDVHPGNVLFRADGAPVLADPGLARALGESPAGAGTAGFAPRHEEAGAPADVFAWGCLAWFVVTGENPQGGGGGTRVPLPLLGLGVTEAMAGLIEDCLGPDPASRPPASALAAELLDAQPAAPLDASAAATVEGAAHLVTRGRALPRARRRSGGAALGRLTPRGWVAQRRRGDTEGETAEAEAAARPGAGHALPAATSVPVVGAQPVSRRGPGFAPGLTEGRRPRRWAHERRGIRWPMTWRARAAGLSAPGRYGRGRAGDRRGRSVPGHGPARWWRLAVAALLLAGLAVGVRALWPAGQHLPSIEAHPQAGSSAVAPTPTSLSRLVPRPATGGPAPVGSATGPPATGRPGTGSAPSEGPRSPAGAAGVQDPVKALRHLDAVRTGALRRGDAAALAHVYANDGLLASDEALIREQRRRGTSYAVLESSVDGASVLSRGTRAGHPFALVRATAVTTASERSVGATGAPASSGATSAPAAPARARATLVFTLSRTTHGWRIAAVAAAGE